MNTPARARIVVRRGPLTWLWLLPILAIVPTYFAVRDFLASRGSTVSVELEDATGIRAAETRVYYRGAEIGRVTGITLREDRRRALVHVRLRRGSGDFARAGARYWMVRPELSAEGLSGFDTIMSGPSLRAAPGDGEPRDRFEGLEHAPSRDGVRFTLEAPRLGHVHDDSAVTYKGIQVGVVRGSTLAPAADHVDIEIVVWPKYARLVRDGTRFWVDSGFSLKGGLLTGMEVNLQSLRTLVAGGIAFATPEKGAAARTGSRFELADEPEKDWLKWSPRMPGGELSGIERKRHGARASSGESGF